MMGDLYKSYQGHALCPVMAAHFGAHAMNICALPPWNADTGPPLLLGANTDTPATPPRHYTTQEIVNLVHTILQGPMYSAELVPYTSDMVLSISDATIKKMMNGSFTEFSAEDFKQSECIDSVGSVPNGAETLRPDDCEGSAALILWMQNNIRALFYDIAEHLCKCNTVEGFKKMTEWVNSKHFCNVDIAPEQIYAFAVNMTVICAVSFMAFDAKLLIIGAMCATPLQKIEDTVEQGHAACGARVNLLAVESTAAAVYAHYDNPETRFTLLKVPALEGVVAIGRPSHATDVQLAGRYSMEIPSVTLSKPSTNFDGIVTTEKMPPGCSGVMKPSFDSQYPCTNVTPIHNNAPCYQLRMIESTTSLHCCPLRGFVAAARMNSLKNAAGKSALATPAVTGVPVEQFLKAVQVSFIKPYLGCSEDVRLQGFTHDTTDPEMPSVGAVKTPSFYKTFYQMDSFSFNTVQPDGSILIGADAETVLNNSHDIDTCTTIENTQIPILSALETDEIKNTMLEQWKETRLPHIGQPALRKMLGKWHSAKISHVYCPDNEDLGIIRCNVGISGKFADKLFDDMSPGGAMHQVGCSANNGMVAQQHPIRMGLNTCIASQAVRTKHFKK